MRSITLHKSPSVPQPLRITFQYVFGERFSLLGNKVYTKIQNHDPGSKDYKDQFVYTPDQVSQPKLNTLVETFAAPGRSVKAAVYCTIETGKYGFGGFSFCFTSDIWSRKQGERLALRRTLERIEDMKGTTGFSLDTPTRGKIWTAWLDSYTQPDVTRFVAQDGADTTPTPSQEQSQVTETQTPLKSTTDKKPSDALLSLLVDILMADLLRNL